jgi:hypothetical protein
MPGDQSIRSGSQAAWVEWLAQRSLNDRMPSVSKWQAIIEAAPNATAERLADLFMDAYVEAHRNHKALLALLESRTFTPATLSAGELASIGGRCGSILGNGSGFGVCNSCRAGALGGSKSPQ